MPFILKFPLDCEYVPPPNRTMIKGLQSKISKYLCFPN